MVTGLVETFHLGGLVGASLRLEVRSMVPERRRFHQKHQELTSLAVRERVVAGVKAARANGKQLGRPKNVFRRDEAVRLHEGGMSWRKIAAELEVPVTTAVEGWPLGEYCSQTHMTSTNPRQRVVAPSPTSRAFPGK
jgi:hypothetical protein